jgi:hypothetical protein
MPYEKMDWPAHWVAVSDPGAKAGLESELQLELGAGHPLFGLPVTVMGRHDSQDDVLFSILDFSGRLAEVHLTWSCGPERVPWPYTRIFSDWYEWKRATEAENEPDD